jgi:hypothetical protein
VIIPWCHARPAHELTGADHIDAGSSELADEQRPHNRLDIIPKGPFGFLN